MYMKTPMGETKRRDFSIFKNWIETRKFLKRIQVRLVFFIIPSVVSLSAAFLEGISIGLLVPLMKGMIEKDFSQMVVKNEANIVGSITERTIN